MKVTYLGQAGLLMECKGLKIMVDPYLSDSVGIADPQKHRRQPVEERFFAIAPDVMVFTHDHLDHYDPDTAQRFLRAFSGVTVLSPSSVWSRVRGFGGGHNYVQFDRHTSWTEQGVRFTAVKAAHSDPAAIGVVVDDGEKKYYITGDTLYNEEIFEDLPADIYAVFLPVNGASNNMNMTDAARFVKRIGAEKAVPVHVGLLDSLSAEDFPCENKVIPEIYKEVAL